MSLSANVCHSMVQRVEQEEEVRQLKHANFCHCLSLSVTVCQFSVTVRYCVPLCGAESGGGGTAAETRYAATYQASVDPFAAWRTR